MEPYRYHVYVCDQRKAEAAACCAARGAGAVVDALRCEIVAEGLADEVQVTTCGSLGLCERGPNMVVYPEGVWYSGVRPEDVPEIVRDHLLGGRPVERLVLADGVALRAEVEAGRAKALAAIAARDAAGVVPDELMAQMRAFMESRIALTALELDLWSAVGNGATAADVAAARKLDAAGAERILNALVAIGLMQKRAATFRNVPVTARFLCAGSPDDARDALRHQLSLWRQWSTLTDAVRAGHAVSSPEMAGRGEEWTVPFIAAMHRNAATRAPLMAQAVGASGIHRMLDVGGGSAAYSIGFARANPTLRAEVLDLPSVLPIADQHIAEAGLTDRIATRAGDLRRDDLGAGFDLVLLSSICHMLGPDENRDLLGRSYRALAAGGRVVISDFLLEPDGTSPRQAALFAINMLVGTPSGSAYTEAEYASWLAAAGFTEIRREHLPGPADLMIGTKAGPTH
jgi:3-hydroxy-5-methyl-1-naphthoate 3-O-methyltransferase